MKILLLLILSIFLFINITQADQHTYYVKPRNVSSPAYGSKDVSTLDFWISPIDYNGNFTETPLLTTTSGTNLTFVLVKNSTLDGFIICSFFDCGGNTTNLGNAFPHGLTVNGTSFNWTVPFVSVATAFYYGAYVDVYWGNAIVVLPASTTAQNYLLNQPGDDWTGDTWRDIAASFIGLFAIMVLLACYSYRSGHRFVRVPGSS